MIVRGETIHFLSLANALVILRLLKHIRPFDTRKSTSKFSSVDNFSKLCFLQSSFITSEVEQTRNLSLASLRFLVLTSRSLVSSSKFVASVVAY